MSEVPREQTEILDLAHVFIRDMDSRIIFWNTGDTRMYGYTAEEVVGRVSHDLLDTIFPEPLEDIEARLMRSGEWEGELTQTRRDGQQITVASYWVLHKDAQGNPTSIVEVNNDISESKRAEESLQETNRRLRILSETASQLLTIDDPQGLVQSLCETVMQFLGCHVFFNFLVSDDLDCLHLNAYAGIPEEAADEIEWLDYGVAVCGCAARDGCRIVAEDIINTPDPRTELVKSYGVQAYACHPLLSTGGRVIGTLSFGSKTKTCFTDEELDLMKTVADQVATAMERMRAEKELEARAQKLEEANEELACTNEELEATTEELRCETEERRLSQESLYRRNAVLDGINRIFREAMTRSSEEELGVLCLQVMEEITGSKFGFIGEMNPEGKLNDVAISDPGWESCRMAAPLGHGRLPISFTVHGVYGRVLKYGCGFYTNDPASHPDSIGVPEGHPPLKAFLGVPLIRDGKAIGMVGLGNREGGYRDEDLEAAESLTPAVVQAFVQKRAEDALRESEEKYRRLFETMQEAFFVVEVITGEQGNPVDARYVDANEQFVHYMGLPREQLVGHTYSEVVPRPDPTWIAVIGKVALTGEPATQELFAPTRRRWLQITSYSPRPGQAATLFTDVTERKQALEALENERRRLQAVLEALPVAMCITDDKGGLVLFNDAFVQVWGGTPPETRSISDYGAYRGWWADTGEPLKPEEWASAQVAIKGKPVIGQLIEIQRFNGTRGFVINSASPICDASGKVVGSAVAIQDITALREAEEAVRKAEESKIEFYRRTISAATDGKLEITDVSEIERVAGPALASWEINTPTDLIAIRHGVAEQATGAGMDHVNIGRFVLAVGEAATNAIKHAGGGVASLHKTDDSVLFLVEDTGQGIKALNLPEVALRSRYSTAGTLGVGYKVMMNVADKVYLATGPEGTAVGVQMSLHPALAGV